MRNRFRIIGGEWGSRRLQFAGASSVRPSPDRVRETLFNWLTPVIEGARCLDLFAGSGALGLEALSRGAKDAVFVDNDRAVLQQIAANLDMLDCDRGHVVHADALEYLSRTDGEYDVVYVDPPYRRDLVPRALALLAAGAWCAPGAYVYIEAEKEADEPALPAGWTLHRSGQAGQVGYHLAKAGKDAR